MLALQYFTKVPNVTIDQDRSELGQDKSIKDLIDLNKLAMAENNDQDRSGRTNERTKEKKRKEKKPGIFQGQKAIAVQNCDLRRTSNISTRLSAFL